MKPRYSTTIVCGFAVGVLSIVPGIKSFACCLLVPLAAAMAIYLDQRLNGTYPIPKSQAAMFGVVTGLSATLFNSIFDLLMTYLFKTNEFVAMLPEVEKMYKSLPVPQEVSSQAIRILRGIEREITAGGFSLFYAAFLVINGFLSNVIFGLIGGISAGSYFNKKNFEKP